MAVNKKFLEAVSQDSELKAELDRSALEALFDVLKAHGLEAEGMRALDAVTEKVAEAHGFKSEAMEEIFEDELEAVAGGICMCPMVGGGTGTGKQCACAMWGKGTNDSGVQCVCAAGGGGSDD